MSKTNLSLIPYSPSIKSLMLFNPKRSNYYSDLILIANKGFQFLDLARVLNFFTKHRPIILELLNNNLKLYSDLKKMDKNPIISCLHLNDSKELEIFKKKVHKKGGIYMIQYKYAPNIFYLGRTTNFNARIRSHFLKSNLLNYRSKLYSAISKIGWEHFNIHILEILDSNINLQIKVENKWLEKYKPVLNSILTANTVAPRVDNFIAFLKDRQRPILERNNKKEFTTYLYEFNFDSKLNRPPLPQVYKDARGRGGRWNQIFRFLF